VEPIPRLLVGLGNPTPKYNRTRHNVGREFIEYLLEESKSSLTKSRQAEIFRLPNFFGVTLVEPLLCVFLSSFMNESGPALKKVIEGHNIKPVECLVVVDDFMIPFGTLRLRSKGSAGGHNGIKSLLEEFQTDQFGRLRIGIGPSPLAEDFADFVLKKFSKAEQEKIPHLFEIARDGLKVLFDHGYEKAKEVLNKEHKL